MKDLIKLLESTESGSRELDKEIYWFFTLPRVGDMETVIPNYTISLDAALTLVPKGACWTLEGGPRIGGIVEIGTNKGPKQGIAKTIALAFCIAALKAYDKEAQ